MNSSLRPAAPDLTRRAALASLFAAVAGCGGGDPDADAGSAPQSSAPPSPPAPPAPPAPSSPLPAPPAAAPSPPAPPARPTWYVDPSNGDDSASGLRSGEARRTLPALRAGDTVLMRRGTTYRFDGNFDPGQDDIVFDAYSADGDPATAPRPVWTTSSPGQAVVWLVNRQRIVLRNLRVAVEPMTTGWPAIRFGNRRPVTQGLLIENCEVVGDDGALQGAIEAAFDGLVVRDSVFACAQAGSFAFGASGAVFIIASSGRAPFAVTGVVWEGNRVTNPRGMGMTIRSGSPTDDNQTTFPGRFVQATFRGNRWVGCGGAGVFLVCGFNARVSLDEAEGLYGWDGLLFEDNVVEDNAGSGASIGPNLRDTARRTVVQRNRVWNNGRLLGTTGGLQLNGLSHALVQDNDCRGNWTTDVFDGVNLFMDIVSGATSEMSTRGAVGCVVRGNHCADARGAGGASFEDWLVAQRQPNSSNAPSSGIRLYFSRANHVYANVLVNNGSGIACDKSGDNWIHHNTAVACTMGYYDGVGLATRGNRFVNNVALNCDWDFYGLGQEGWTTPRPTTAPVVLSAAIGSYVSMSGPSQFEVVRLGVAGRNSFVRETDDAAGTRGLAVVSNKESEDEVRVHVLRPFSATTFPAGALTLGSMEAYAPGALERNARHGSRLGSLRHIPAGAGDIEVDPQLDAQWRPLPASPLRRAGIAVPQPPFAELTDRGGRPFAAPPTLGAYEPA